MTIDEFIRYKIEMESDIRHFLQNKIEACRTDSGLVITKIEVDINYSPLGGNYTIVDGIKIVVEI